MTYAKLHLESFDAPKEKSQSFTTKLIETDLVAFKFIVTNQPSIKTKIRLSYSNFPYISALLHFILVVSLFFLVLYVLLGIRYVHPLLLIWLIIASGGLSRVAMIASGELNGTKR